LLLWALRAEDIDRLLQGRRPVAMAPQQHGSSAVVSSKGEQ